MKRRVLVADDSSTIQKVVKIAFSKYAIDILESGSYIEALSEINQNKPEALIVDASLPGTKGPEDFAKLSFDAGKVPLILLVGSYETVDEEKFKEAGLKYFLKKPFESSDIVTLLNEALGTEISNKEVTGTGATLDPASIPNVSPTSTTIIPPPPGGGAAMPGPMDGASIPPVPSAVPPTIPAAPIPAAPIPAATESAEMPVAPAGAPTPPPPQPPSGGGDINLPPSPMMDIAQKGKKAFSLEDDEPTQEREAAPEVAAAPPPPPVVSAEPEEQTIIAEMPPPPPTFSIKDREDEPKPTPAAPETRHGDKNDDPPKSEFTIKPPPQPPKKPTEIPIPPISREVDDGVEISSPMLGIPGGLDAELSDKLPSIARKVIEEYCQRHFNSLAKEIITNELRRLADEKARHLVDN